MEEKSIRLRAVEPSDLDTLYRLENDPEVWRVSWGEAPLSRQMLWEYITNYTADVYRDRQLRFVIEVDGVAAGTVDISDFDPRNSRAMLGIAVDKDWQHRGVAHRAVAQVMDYCRMALHLHQLAVLVPRDNAASMKLFLDSGFTTSGCLRSWLRRGDSYVDVIVLQRMLANTSGN